MIRTLAAAALLASLAAPAFAEDSALERFGKAAGFIAPTPDPPDFVKASRPQAEPDSIPVFSEPAEPRSRVKNAAELKAMDADLENAARGHRSSPAKGKTRKSATR